MSRKPWRGKQPRTPETVEPVFFHSHPMALYEDICKAFELKAIIDMTPGAATWPYGPSGNLIYTGLCMADVHREKLMQHL